LEFFDTWRAVMQHGQPFVHHTAESLEADIPAWLGQPSAQHVGHGDVPPKRTQERGSPLLPA
jgi:hypothetical protein